MTRRETIDQSLAGLEFLEEKLYAIDFPDEILIHIHNALRRMGEARASLRAAKLAEDIHS